MAITLESLDRGSIRALAEKHSAELGEVAQNGGNVYQASLDQQDKINEFSSALSEEESIRFITIYSEELSACANKTNDEASAILAETDAKNEAATAIGGLIGFAALVFIIYMVFL